ncbi:MAG: EAL domain-containing protein [Clostridia bacterium]|nr:EAL domain-containing protein [Clostridia bacterium]
MVRRSRAPRSRRAPDAVLRAAADVLAAGDLRQIAQRLLRAALDLIHAESGEVLAAWEGTLEVIASQGLKEGRDEGCLVPFGAGVTGRAAMEGRSVWVPDVKLDPLYIEGVPGALWELAIPLRGADGCVRGVLSIESRRPERPDDERRQRVEALATLVGPTFAIAQEVVRLRLQTESDPLTGMLSPLALHDRLQRLQAGRAGPWALVVVDLDDYRAAKDELGHVGAEQVLRQVADGLLGLLPSGAIVARWGDDTFAAVIPVAEEKAVAAAEELRRRAAAAWPASCGVAPCGEGGWADWLDRAYAALLAAKRRGGGQTVLWEPGFGVGIRAPTEEQWRRFLLGEGMRTVYQPIVAMGGGGEVVGFEALARGPAGTPWETPGRLFAAARRAGLLEALDVACLRLACQRRPASAGAAGRSLFVNIEPDSLVDAGWRRTLADTVREAALAPGQLVLELTERAAAPEVMDALADFRRSVGADVRIAIDDFGVGAANLAAVLEASPDFLKLDRSLVSGIERDVRRQSLIESIVLFARRTGVHLVAEGVETQEQLRTLQRLGVHLAQGFLLGVPAEHTA